MTVEDRIREALKTPELARVTQANEAWFWKMSERWRNAERNRFRERFGWDPKPQTDKPGFNLLEAKKQLRERYKLNEAVTETQLFALTTFMLVDNIVGAYQLKPVIYRKLAKIVQSRTLDSNFFPLQRGDIPLPVAEGEETPESSLGGNLTRIRNYKFARTIPISEEMEQDDQTGQVLDMANILGEGMAYAEEQWWIINLLSQYVAAQIRSAGGIIPPMCVAGQAPSGYGGPTCTAGAVSQVNIENLFTAAEFVTDIEGNFALVVPNAGLFSSGDKIAVKKIMQSVYNPSTPSASANVVGGIFSENVLKGEFEMYFTPFIIRARAGIASGNPWGLGEAGKIGAFQDRTPLTVIQEVPNAGQSFDRDLRRTKAKRRFGAGVVLPEFFLVGN